MNWKVVELGKELFPDAPDETDRIVWVIRIASSCGTLQVLTHSRTQMCNYSPKTFDEMVEAEARQMAEGIAKRLGIRLREYSD